MQLTSLEFSDHTGDNREWNLAPLALRDLNLIVGVNSSGKSRALSAIGTLAWLISNKAKIDIRTCDSKWRAHFSHEGKETIYFLCCRGGHITEETFVYDGVQRMSRGSGGAGHIFATKECKDVAFQPPDTELGIVSRKDSSQHGFFDPLHKWAESVYRYAFGSTLGKNFVAVEMQNGGVPLDHRNSDEVINIFAAGQQLKDSTFVDSVRADMSKLGYPIDAIGTTPPTVIVPPPLPGRAKYLYVQESGLDCPTETADMSQGMFRALSIIIQLNYSQLAAKPACIIVDDIGEGLDFGRSCALIKLLTERTAESHIQLIMSTNDRFVMNQVPLAAWTVLRREKSSVRVFNYTNSKELFDEFGFTGLNNFDFFATDFLGDSIATPQGGADGTKETRNIC